jgi:sporulation protein YlmC with PRC-barrel domain
MEVINSDGYILGKIKELALVLGEPDQAITIESGQGRLDYIRWSVVAAAGDVILLKTGSMPATDAPAVTRSFTPSGLPPVTQPAAQPVAGAGICPGCGAELESGNALCTNCGYRVRA